MKDLKMLNKYWLIDEDNQVVVFAKDKNNIVKFEDEYDCPDNCIDDFYKNGIKNSVKIETNEVVTKIPIYTDVDSMKGIDYLIFNNNMKIN